MANTRDTLCYATNENQDATYGLLKTKADLAIVVEDITVKHLTFGRAV